MLKRRRIRDGQTLSVRRLSWERLNEVILFLHYSDKAPDAAFPGIPVYAVLKGVS
jgi:hypothetical protein